MRFKDANTLQKTLFSMAEAGELPETGNGYTEPPEHLRRAFTPSGVSELDAIIERHAVPVFMGASVPATAGGPGEARIELVDPEHVDSPATYARILAHELVHWAGRNLTGRPIPSLFDSLFDSPVYPREELVAELGAAMLLDRFGQDVPAERSAAYLRNWLEAIRPELREKAIAWAERESEKAVDALLA